MVLDRAPAKLRVNPNDVAGRAALERRKLREILNFCYTDYCFRAHILDYFGDPHHARNCGTCGNCSPRSYASTLPELKDAARSATIGKTARKSRGNAPVVVMPRALDDDELLRVRKILACATRMRGRFGKNILASTLRGSAAAKVLQSRLNELSTYGLLSDMKQDDIMLYIEALIDARCLKITAGEYPMVVITDLGEAVMRERERIELALPKAGPGTTLVRPTASVSGAAVPSQTVLETYNLYRQGVSIDDIATRRNCTSSTVENHLVDCVRAGLAVELSQFVSDDERAQIQKAIAEHGAAKLRPIRECLPESITYTKIRLVIAAIEQQEAQPR